MVDCGRRGREAVAGPEITRREGVSGVAAGEYGNICFIHEISACSVEDVATRAAPPEIAPGEVDL
jgi:hypothetical protein